MSDEKTPDINVEMCKCYSFELMSEQELRESPVAFNPKIYIRYHKKFNFGEDGLVTGCCDKHVKSGVEFGNCPKHPKATNWNSCKSFSLPAINVKHDTFGLVMFHDHTWYDKSLKSHLTNDEILITFPLNEIEWISGNMVTIYSKHKHPIKTAFNDVKFIYPCEQESVWLPNWNMRDSFLNCRPIIENWWNGKSLISTRLQNRLLSLEKTIAEAKKSIQRKKDDECKWWNSYVEHDFHVQFFKQCKGKWSTKYKIGIKGIPFDSIQKHVSIYDGDTHNNMTLKITTNRQCTIIKGSEADWIIGYFFNSGVEYIFSNPADNIEFTTFDNKFEWSYNKSQTLFVWGKLKYRAPNGPWIKND